MMEKNANFQCCTVLRTRNVLTGNVPTFTRVFSLHRAFESNFPSQLTCLIKNNPERFYIMFQTCKPNCRRKCICSAFKCGKRPCGTDAICEMK